GTCIHGKEKNRLYINRGMEKRPQFMDAAEFVGMTQVGNWRGMATADFDNDGHMDLISSSLYRDPLVFKNVPDKKMESHWFGLSLESLNAKCNRMAIGSKIFLTISEPKEPTKRKTIFVETTLVNGFSAQHDQRVHIGLGKNSIIEELKISWCGKKEMTATYSNVKVDSYNSVVFEK
ncbi:MAG: CRTAC1 family protein, partial [Bdellovibrionales bacterium]|nr:CRTAC1 family protein [Bdellovibrionales bacterium]